MQISPTNRSIFHTTGGIIVKVTVWIVLHVDRHVLTQQTSFTVHRLPTKEQISVFRIYILKRQYIYRCIYIYIYRYVYVNIPLSISMYTLLYIHICRFKRKTEAQAICLNPFTVCSSSERKFVICPYVYKQTNGSYLFANGLNGLAHLWFYIHLALFIIAQKYTEA